MDRYRVIQLSLGLALAAVVVGTVLLAPGGSPRDVPEQIERATPDPTTEEVHFDPTLPIEVDMKVNYSLVMTIDGIRVPEDQVDFSAATGKYVFRPGEAQVVERWSAGRHTVFIEWDTLTGLADPGQFVWRFQIKG
ncbi:MAG: hypothetical protein KJP12_01960 [Acidimicrobiia bacterium]|nr:hypothetical protein [Acidimicrobiia bacterium]MBT8213959.1 hypothetical protein [Acidimicrobiia bacterium]NNF70417.1 hypothetical protein [Acidimicrobiia bacterium]